MRLFYKYTKPKLKPITTATHIPIRLPAWNLEDKELQICCIDDYDRGDIPIIE